MRVSGIWKRRTQETGDAQPVTWVHKPAGYWEGRLSVIGGHLDGHGGTIHQVVVSVGGGSVWLSALRSGSTWADPEWGPFSVRVAGVGIDALPDPAATGRWASWLAAGGRVLDRDNSEVREPCIIQEADGLLITGLVPQDGDWVSANWRLDADGNLV